MSFRSWREYFEKNKSHFGDINWVAVDNLTPEEKNCIAASIAQFQKGESSEGKHLFSHAKKYPDPEYTECIKLFIREEQMHARVLGQFMDKQNIPRIKNHWVDGIFRWLRKLAGMENTIVVLVTAEIIAKIYYNALNHATSSVLLKSICRQILKDEDQHISFQCYTINKLAENKKYMGRIIRQSWHLILMLGTIMVVWMTHRGVLKKGGYYFSRFWLETLLVFLEADRNIKNNDVVINYITVTSL